MSIRTWRNSKRAIATAAAVAIGLSTVAISSAAGAEDELSTDAAAVTPVRLAGEDRYGTSATAATALCGAWRSAAPGGLNNYLARPTDASTNIIIATGTNWPDGLAANALAAGSGPRANTNFARLLQAPVGANLNFPAPVLLVNPAGLSQSSITALSGIQTSCGINTVEIVGGESAIPAAVAGQLVNVTGRPVTRIFGADRYATAREIALNASNAPVVRGFRTIFAPPVIATGQNFADALSASSWVALMGAPLFLNDGPVMSADNLTLLNNLTRANGLNAVTIMGGPAAVPMSVENQLAALGYNVTRFGGDDRYATAANFASGIATNALNLGQAAGFFPFQTAAGNVALVSGENFPDALSAGAPAASFVAPIVLTRANSLPSATANFLRTQSPFTNTVWAFGGTSAISADTLTAAVNASIFSPTEITSARYTPAVVQPSQIILTTQAGVATTTSVTLTGVGTAAGALGNDWVVNLAAQANFGATNGATVSAQVTTAAGVAPQLGLTFQAGVNSATLSAAINANPVASSVFTAASAGGAALLPDANFLSTNSATANLASGRTNLTVAVTFDRAMAVNGTQIPGAPPGTFWPGFVTGGAKVYSQAAAVLVPEVLGAGVQPVVTFSALTLVNGPTPGVNGRTWTTTYLYGDQAGQSPVWRTALGALAAGNARMTVYSTGVGAQAGRTPPGITLTAFNSTAWVSSGQGLPPTPIGTQQFPITAN